MQNTDLVQILASQGGALSPEELFRLSKWTEETIDDFYASLKVDLLDQKIEEIREGYKVTLRSMS
jgi:hypothetical protein